MTKVIDTNIIIIISNIYIVLPPLGSYTNHLTLRLAFIITLYPLNFVKLLFLFALSKLSLNIQKAVLYYCNKEVIIYMGFSNRGLRGSTFEEMINLTNEKYKTRGLALIQKIPTPITPVAIDKESRTITLAYFEKQSSVDYIGVVQGIPICFDAKETRQKSLNLSNLHSHQIDFMSNFVTQKGLAFILVYFGLYNEYYALPFDTLNILWQASKNGGRKSIPHEAFKNAYKLSVKGGYIHYLEAINDMLESLNLS